MPKVQQLPSHLHSHPIAMLLVDRATNKIVDFNKAARTAFQINRRKSADLHLSNFTTKRKLKLIGNSKNLGICPFQTKTGKVDFTVFAYAMDKNAKYSCYELHPVQSTQTVAIERTLKAFLDNAKEVIFLLAPDFKIIAFNKPAQLSIQAIHKKQVKIGDSMLDYSEASTHDLFKKHFLQALAGKDVNLEIEVPFENYDRWWNVTYRQIIDSNKQMVGVAFSAVDIHDRRMAEEEALDLATKLKATLNASNDYTYLINPQYQIVVFNEGARLSIKEFQGRDVAIGDSILDYLAEPSKSVFLERMSRAFAGETIAAEVYFEIPLVRHFWFDARYAPVRNGNDQVAYVSFSLNNITASKANEQALRKKELQLNALADNIPKAVVFQYLEGSDGNFDGFPYMSSGSKELFGFSHEQIQLDPLMAFKIVHPDDLAKMLELNQESRTTGSIYNNTHRIIVEGKVKWINTVSKPVQLPDESVQWDGFSIDVTDRKLSEAALKILEASLQAEKKEADKVKDELLTRFEKISLHVPGFIYQFRMRKDGSTHLPYASNGIEKIFGVTPKDAILIADKVFDKIHPDDLDGVREKISHSAATMTDWKAEFRVKLLTGQTIWAEGESSPQAEPDGSILWHGYISDITDRKLAEQELISSEERFRLIYNQSPVMMDSINDKGELESVNDYWLEKMGYTRAEVIGKEANNILTPETRKLAEERVLKDFYNNGQLANVEYDYLTKSGKIINGLLSANAERDDQGRVIRSFSVITDITERKQLEKQNESLQLRLQLISDNLPNVAIYQYLVKAGKFDGHYTYFSNGLQELTGITPVELLNDPSLFEKQIDESDFKEKIKVIKKVNRDFSPLDHTYRFRHRDGRWRWLQTKSQPTSGNDGETIWNGLIIDVTDQKLAEQDLELKKFTINHSSESITWIRPDGSFADVNLGAVNLLGYSFDELIKMSVPLIDDNYNEEVWPLHWQELREKKFLTFETVQRKKDGTLVDVEVNANYISFEGEEFNCAYVRDITERKRSENRLIESEAKYRLLANNMQDMVCLHSLDGLYEYVSPSTKNLLGYGPEELLGKDPYNFTHPDDTQRLREDSHRAVIQGKTARDITYRFRHKDGHYVWLETQSITLFGETNQPIGIQTSSRDVTLRKEVASKLIRSQKLYESIVNSQSNFLIRTDMLGYYSFVSQRFLNHFGFKEQDVIGRHSFESIHPEDHAACEKAVMECIYTPGKITSVAFRKPNKQGDFFWTEWEFIAIQNEEQVITEIQGIGYDITDKLAYQKQLAETSNRLMVATQSAGIGVWELDIANDLLIWDDEMYRIFGVAREGKLNYESFYNCIYPEDRTKMDLVLAQGLKEKNTVRFRTRIVRGTDKTVRHIQGFGIFKNQEPTVIVGVNYDITDVIENELAIEKAKSKIEELQLQSLRAAMNPHFIFNALASLQYFITHNKREDGIQFLSKFSKLVRGILNSSIANESPLASELELIRYYVEIEQIRFEHKFDFELLIDPAIDVEIITIPALLIQPYVENAIIHGLYAKPSRGKLKLNLVLKHDYLYIVIEDNGIGRQAGAIMRERNFPKHQSHGMGITLSRIDLIRNSRPIESLVEDLEENGSASGTRITISIKM